MMRPTIRKGSTAYTILKVIAAASIAGVAVAAFAVAPGLAVIARGLLDSAEEGNRAVRLRRQKQISAAVQRLVRRRLVRYDERGKETFLVITRNGHSEVKKFEFEELILPSAKKWDGKWHMVIFDIPERYRRGREALRAKLGLSGFYPLQKSVFIYPYECRDEIDFVARFCDVERWVEYLVCNDLGRSEVKARRHFDLLLSTP